MRQLTSNDGTPIAYDRAGSGPAVVLVGGALVDPATGRAGRWENAPLATELARHYTVYNYDRRGRGESGDGQPYALEREIEDIDALIAEAGGSAVLYGVSSGGALALEAAAAGSAVERIAVYDVPYSVGAGAWQRWRDYLERLGPLLAEDRRDAAIELFMRVAGAPDDAIAEARSTPAWPNLEAIAHTLAYDAACLNDGRPPNARLATIEQPTLVLSGGHDDFFELAADTVAASLPNARRHVLVGQSHAIEATALAPVLGWFFGG